MSMGQNQASRKSNKTCKEATPLSKLKFNFQCLLCFHKPQNKDRMATSASSVRVEGPQPVAVNASKLDEPEIVEAAPEDHPTESHELAKSDHEEKGAAQRDHGQTEVKDLGWNESPTEAPNPVVGGLANEELWTLIRRFNKVCSSLLRLIF
jgi:hypothetical protein